MAKPEHEEALYRAIQTSDASADLMGLDLTGVACFSGRLDDLNLTGSDLSNSNFDGCYLVRCNLSSANLSKFQISTGDLRDAIFDGANLTQAQICNSVLNGASFKNADLSNGSFVKSRVNDVDFSGANLTKTDLRGVKGLTAEQVHSATNAGKAILDQRMLDTLGWSGDKTVARHGRSVRKKREHSSNETDVRFTEPKPTFGELFLCCGYEHPNFPASHESPFRKLGDMKIEQVDDYFAICRGGDPVIWIFPLVKGKVVEHHPGPFDGVRITVTSSRYQSTYSRCVAQFREAAALQAVDK